MMVLAHGASRGARNPNLHHACTVRIVGSFVRSTSANNAVECMKSQSDNARLDLLSLVI